MAQGLIIGGTPVRVRKDTWQQEASTYQGARMRMAFGNVVSTEYAEARAFTCSLYFLSIVEETVVKLLAPRGIPVSISGELPGGTFDVLIDFLQSTSLKKSVGGVWVLHRRCNIRLEEVEPGA